VEKYKLSILYGRGFPYYVWGESLDRPPVFRFTGGHQGKRANFDREFGPGKTRREPLGVLGGKAAQNIQNPSYTELTLLRFSAQ